MYVRTGSCSGSFDRHPLVGLGGRQQVVDVGRPAGAVDAGPVVEVTTQSAAVNTGSDPRTAVGVVRASLQTWSRLNHVDWLQRRRVSRPPAGGVRRH